jgi:hypothetical protein
VLLYHWYERVPPSVIDALTVKVAVPPEEILVLAGCVPIIGVWASGEAVIVTSATELAIVTTFTPVTVLLVFVITQ